ncbi:MAG: hypothetical protein HY744_34220, partial [Deltaproteobacteria bacterium]|nr:hypothetical protein [Deltaproteobacteria bacterium]
MATRFALPVLRVHNFIEFIAAGRATRGLADALAQAEEQSKTLSADVASMGSAKDQAFTPPPRAWIADRIAKLNDLLGMRTEQSALALRRLTGPVTLTPRQPEVGRPYFQAACRIDSLNLLVADGGSNLLRWWSRGHRTLGRLVRLVEPGSSNPGSLGTTGGAGVIEPWVAWYDWWSR